MSERESCLPSPDPWLLWRQPVCWRSRLRKRLHDLALLTSLRAQVYTDVALDPYNSDGHDGIVRDDGVIMNDATVEFLCRHVSAQTHSSAVATWHSAAAVANVSSLQLIALQRPISMQRVNEQQQLWICLCSRSNQSSGPMATLCR